MLAEVTQLNSRIAALAPVLNAPEARGLVSVSTAPATTPVDLVAKRAPGSAGIHVFAVAMRDAATRATFRVNQTALTTANVLWENRSIPVVGGGFEDDFGPYGVHAYVLS